MPLLRPFRDYDEKDVINLYSFSGQTSTTEVINRGTLVKVVGSGWRTDVEPVEMLGSYGDFSVWNVQAQRYGTPAKVGYCGATSSDIPLGITLFDIRELDENGIPLKYNPRKAAELEACISGQTVPVVTRGIFLYSGLTGAFSAGAKIYAGAAGTITAYPTNTTSNVTGALSGTAFTGLYTYTANPVVGTALGTSGADGFTLIRLAL